MTGANLPTGVQVEGVEYINGRIPVFFKRKSCMKKILQRRRLRKKIKSDMAWEKTIYYWANGGRLIVLLDALRLWIRTSFSRSPSARELDLQKRLERLRSNMTRSKGMEEEG